MGTAENRDKSKMVMGDNLNLQAVPITKTRNRKEKPDVFEEHGISVGGIKYAIRNGQMGLKRVGPEFNLGSSTEVTAKAIRLNEITRENTERKIRANVSYVRDPKFAEQK